MYKCRMSTIIVGIFFMSCSLFYNEESKAAEPVFSRALLDEMFMKDHEGVPHGVPTTYGWQHGPTGSYWLKPPAGWNQVVTWGQVYADASNAKPDVDFPNARVHLKDLHLYIYRTNGTWELLLNDVNPIGEMYSEDFRAHPELGIEYWKKADPRKEAEGGISIKAGSVYNFHFYSNKKATIDLNNIAGFFVVCKTRLIGAENNSTKQKYLVNVGGDYYNSNGSGNGDIAIGRFKYVTPQWQYVVMHTFTKEQIKNMVFPIE